jgi:hypothetical protein
MSLCKFTDSATLKSTYVDMYSVVVLKPARTGGSLIFTEQGRVTVQVTEDTDHVAAVLKAANDLSKHVEEEE